MTSIGYFPVPREDKPVHFCEVRDAHLSVFGIHPHLVHALNQAYHEVRLIEDQEGSTLEVFDRIESMCLDTARPGATLAYNQCFRWHMLLSVLAELSQMEERFGNGCTDSTES